MTVGVIYRDESQFQDLKNYCIVFVRSTSEAKVWFKRFYVQSKIMKFCCVWWSAELVVSAEMMVTHSIDINDVCLLTFHTWTSLPTTIWALTMRNMQWVQTYPRWARCYSRAYRRARHREGNYPFGGWGNSSRTETTISAIMYAQMSKNKFRVR